MGFLKAIAVAALVAVVQAQTRITFTSSGTQIVGYYWSPSTQNGSAPAIVMAHGLGGLQTSRLQPFAERFAAAGYYAMTFDYRYWGQSAGTPRNIIDVPSQQEDYEAAIAAIKTVSGVDADRIVVWGTSLSGGHVLELGVKRPDLTAVIAQVPHVNGPATIAQLPPLSLPGLVAAGVTDAARGAAGESPLYIPTANKTGEFGALTQTGAYAGYQFVQPNPPPPGNVFPARFINELPFFNPDVIAASTKLPTFIGVGLLDNIVSPNATNELAARMPTATTHEYPNAGHFDVYPGKATYEQNVEYQIAFLKSAVPI